MQGGDIIFDINYYIADTTEEKVLGSILLPSYTISPVSKDDGVYRKFAFKAEHAGMRTYMFAAETKDSMMQWMNSMSLASILQNENKLRPELLARELARQGRQQHLQQQPGQQFRHNQQQRQQQQHQQLQVHYQHQQQNYQQQQGKRAVPAGYPMSGGGGEARQPLYANAPPKPRRLNTSRDYSASPDNSPERPSQSDHLQQQQQQLRHRNPQERRTPEAYGRSRFDNSGGREGGKYPSKDYEEVYNNEEVAQYNTPRLSNGNIVSHRNSQRFDRHHPMEEVHIIHQLHPQRSGPVHHVEERQQRIARPHSADFLEYERNHPTTGQPARRSVNTSSKPQPQRPKSCIGQKIRTEDFWSEEGYAKKMRESAFVFEQSNSRSQSRGSQPIRPPMIKSHTLPANTNDQNKNTNTFYPYPGMEGPEQVPPPVFYQDSSPPAPPPAHHNNFPPSYQPPPHHQRMTPSRYSRPAQHESVEEREQQMRQLSQHQQSQPAGRGGYRDQELTVPPSFPQPQPRKVAVTPGSTPGSTYQNIPATSKSFSDPRPMSVCRVEGPNTGRFDEDSSPGDFRRSASARLAPQKTRHSEYLNNTLSGESDDSKRNGGEPVGREESMKRLLNWKQRMLQSPLTRKSSRNASRTQTPTNSDSPVPSLNDDIRKKVLEELQYTEPSQVPREKRLSRKGSSGSRSSRSRSSPRIAPSKSQLVSSDDEGKVLILDNLLMINPQSSLINILPCPPPPPMMFL